MESITIANMGKQMDRKIKICFVLSHIPQGGYENNQGDHPEIVLKTLPKAARFE